MDKLPRWSDGYGIQTRLESQTQTKLRQSGEPVANPDGLKGESLIQWLEGVYTFEKSLRVTFKFPYYYLKAARKLVNGVARDLEGRGGGDLILAVPVKQYVNLQDYTFNVGFTPAVTLPTGSTAGELPVGRGAYGFQLGGSAYRETRDYYLVMDLFAGTWTKDQNDVRKGISVGFDYDFAYAFHLPAIRGAGGYALLGTEIRAMEPDTRADGSSNPNSGGATIDLGPGVVLHWFGWLARVEYRVPVWQKLRGTQLVNDPTFKIGLGAAF